MISKCWAGSRPRILRPAHATENMAWHIWRVIRKWRGTNKVEVAGSLVRFTADLCAAGVEELAELC